MDRLLLVLLSASMAIAAPLQRLSVTCSSRSASGCAVGAWGAKGWTAQAAFRPSQNETGWATLLVEVPNGAADERLAAFAAGFAEGFASADLFWPSWVNFVNASPAPSDKLLQFVTDQMKFVQNQVLRSAKEDRGDEAAYWRSVGLVVDQLYGLTAGYAAAAKAHGLQPLTEEQILLLNLNVELSDIQLAVEPTLRPDFGMMSDKDFFKHQRHTSRCSALFRVTPELDNILAAHTTWSEYFWMLRVYKAYTLPFADAKAETVLFSSYPGEIASIDDFYTTSQKLAVIETTNDVYNMSLYDFVTPNTVPYWIRATVATRLASTSKEWHDLFYLHNSGTYNNQWMVADYKLLSPGKELPPWTFSVSEQLPGSYYHPGEDKTAVLQAGHWASYNVPYFRDVYVTSGYPEMVQKHGVEAGYQLAPRAPIFRRDADKVKDLDSLKVFMRENNFGSSDPLAKTACHAIACREDLMMEDPEAFGAIDAKVVDSRLMGALATAAISGPTAQRQPPFQFLGQWSEVPHMGMPDTFNFEWQLYSLESLQRPDGDLHEVVV